MLGVCLMLLYLFTFKKTKLHQAHTSYIPVATTDTFSSSSSQQMPKKVDCKAKTSRQSESWLAHEVSKSDHIWRPQSTADFGIDGELEFMTKSDARGDRVSTYKLVKVQLKATSVEVKSRSLNFNAKIENYVDWAAYSYSIPIIGILYSTRLKEAAWFDLGAFARLVVRCKKGDLSYGYPLHLDCDKFDADSLTTNILPHVCQWDHYPSLKTQLNVKFNRDHETSFDHKCIGHERDDLLLIPVDWVPREVDVMTKTNNWISEFGYYSPAFETPQYTTTKALLTEETNARDQVDRQKTEVRNAFDRKNRKATEVRNTRDTARRKDLSRELKDLQTDLNNTLKRLNTLSTPWKRLSGNPLWNQLRQQFTRLPRALLRYCDLLSPDQTKELIKRLDTLDDKWLDLLVCVLEDRDYCTPYILYLLGLSPRTSFKVAMRIRSGVFGSPSWYASPLLSYYMTEADRKELAEPLPQLCVQILQARDEPVKIERVEVSGVQDIGERVSEVDISN